jgi:hypothetical protein
VVVEVAATEWDSFIVHEGRGEGYTFDVG